MIPILLAILLTSLVSTVYIGYRISMLQGDIYALRSRVSGLERHVADMKGVTEWIDGIDRRITCMEANLEVLVASQELVVEALDIRNSQDPDGNDTDSRH